ncbi:DNA methyltransferase [Thiospirochaeta perfilievii]|uniref:DNA methyltransferase n=1 Tax=Thiospirochaeta perfilievii TaxID=252967 RepID=UPI001CA88657|nr:DNA methyltransferase [Thiospirochaeta perfilievii]
MEERDKINNQVVSRQRVSDHGEVYTSEREVNAMLDLVKQETERIESRFLEPACGTGNFLVQILRRKLNIVVNRYRKSQVEFERYAVIAVSSIYGVDILEDNVEACRKRLLDLFEVGYKKLYKENIKIECLKSIEYILSYNIIWGDALTLKKVSEKKEPIVFSEWSPVNGSKIKRRDFTYENLLEAEKSKIPGDLFADVYETDPAFLPKPIKEYPLTHFLRISDVE